MSRVTMIQHINIQISLLREKGGPDATELAGMRNKARTLDQLIELRRRSEEPTG